MNDVQNPPPASQPTSQPLGRPADSTQELAAGPPQTRPGGLRHRVLGLRGVAAVAVATLIIGGSGGLALGALSNRSDDSVPSFRNGPGQLQQQPGQQQGQVPGQQGGQQGGPGLGSQDGGLPPGTAPQDDVRPDTQPDSQGDTSGGATNS